MIENNTKDIQDKIVLNIIKRAFMNNPDIIQCISEIRDYNDELSRHSFHVALLSLLIGIKNGMSASELEEIFIAGLLHDYGKLLIPLSILEKKDRLTIEERSIIELHPAAGFLMLKKNTMRSDKIIYAVLDHHEKEDGSGYSHRKNSNIISNFTKIITIADIYDAMVSDRAYRKAMDISTVREYLLTNAGRSLDYDQVILFSQVLNDCDLKAYERRFHAVIQALHDHYIASDNSEINRKQIR